MLGSAIAILLQASAPLKPAPAPATAAAQVPAGWNLASSDQGCIVHTTERAGIVLSVFALPERDGIGFLLQNRKWSDLSDGHVYALGISFDDGSVWPIPALARTEIDADGPGLYFAVRPGREQSGRDFVAEFSAARGMSVVNDDVGIGTLRLRDAHAATLALADCLRGVVEGRSNPFRASDGAPTATRI